MSEKEMTIGMHMCDKCHAPVAAGSYHQCDTTKLELVLAQHTIARLRSELEEAQRLLGLATGKFSECFEAKKVADAELVSVRDLLRESYAALAERDAELQRMKEENAALHVENERLKGENEKMERRLIQIDKERPDYAPF